MEEIFYKDELVEIFIGDTRRVLKNLPNDSIDCVVTSPPY